MSCYQRVVICPVGGHPGNYEHFGPFEGGRHARLWIATVHSGCEWKSDEPNDFQTYGGHKIRPLTDPAERSA